MKIFFIGIKGSGMSALATILKQYDHTVLGSDVDKQFFTDIGLKQQNISVCSFEDEIDDDVDLVILGNAFADDHPQVVSAKRKKIKVMRYFTYLSEFANTHLHSIAVAGTNGKTTTTTMLATMLSTFSPSYLIGDGTGVGNSAADTFIFEACEYKNTFHNYFPEFGIINNVEMDHPDFFKNIDDVVNTFQGFANNCKYVIVNLDDEPSTRLVEKNNMFYTFSVQNSSATLHMTNITKNQQGFGFDLFYLGNKLGTFSLPFFGDHMIQNSLSCLLIGCLLGIDINILIANLSGFKGAKRRFEQYELDNQKNIILIDDYAHHPTAINLTIDSIRWRYPDYKLTVLFQPHTYSRTLEFLDEFAESLVKADSLYLEPIFGSIREGNGTVTIEDLKDKVKLINKDVLLNNFDDIDFSQANHIICLLGAGDIDTLYLQKINDIVKGQNE